MGRICAPAYASILMSKFSILNPLIKDKSILFLRFIDFMIWTKSVEELRNFRNLTNQKHQPIKFDFKFSKHKLEFIHLSICITLVYKDKNNILQTTLFKKQQLIAKIICKQNPHIRIRLRKALLISKFCE